MVSPKTYLPKNISNEIYVKNFAVRRTSDGRLSDASDGRPSDVRRTSDEKIPTKKFRQKNLTSMSTSILRPCRPQFYVHFDLNFTSMSTSVIAVLTAVSQSQYYCRGQGTSRLQAGVNKFVKMPACNSVCRCQIHWTLLSLKCLFHPSIDSTLNYKLALTNLLTPTCNSKANHWDSIACKSWRRNLELLIC